MKPRPEDLRRPDMKQSLAKSFRQYERSEDRGHAFWRSLGLLGSIGWPIVVLTAGGALLGHWLDRRYHSNSWALTLVLAGAVLGSWAAWHSVRSVR